MDEDVLCNNPLPMHAGQTPVLYGHFFFFLFQDVITVLVISL